MRALKYTILAALVALNTSFSQTTYTWVGDSSSNWNSPTSWNPMRINGQVTDILVFETGSTVQAKSVNQQTLGQLIIRNNTQVTLEPSNGNPKTLSIQGGEGEDLIIEAGSSLEIFSDKTSLGIYLKNGTTASINGSVLLRGEFLHYINALDENSIRFKNGSVLTQSCPGYIFTNSGTSNVVVFENGSTFIMGHSSALTPFGIQPPNSKVLFMDESTFSVQTSCVNSLSLCGRTYGNLVITSNSNVQVTEFMEYDIEIQSFTVISGCALTVSNTNQAYQPAFWVKKFFTVNGSFSVGGNIKLLIDDPRVITSSETNEISPYLNSNSQDNLSGGTPERFSVSQNYPNPFNSSTVIEYYIPFDSRVQITITGVNGNTIRTLVYENLKPGNHKTLFYAGDLSSGVYFYTIIAESAGKKFSKTIKMIMVK